MLLIGLFLLGFVSAFILLALATGPSNADHYNDFNAALKTAHGVATVTADSAEADQAVKAWKAALADLTFPTDAQKTALGKVYADNLFFNDTLKTLRSGDEVTQHLLATAEMLSRGSVECFATTRDANGDYYIRWQMSYAGPKLNSGEPIVTIGMTQLRFNGQGQVILHQDYWDASTGVFEHSPLVGGLVKFIRGRM